MPVEPSRRVRWLLVLLVLGLTLVAYLPALKAGFVNWDDDSVDRQGSLLTRSVR
ncbi:MAG: hypothetical protein P8Y11_11095 [Gemmatimonadales bacterium]